MGSSRRNFSLTIALCASLTAHALALLYVADRYVRLMDGHIRLPGFGFVIFADAPPPPDPRERIGESDGTGKAVFATPGDAPLLAPRAAQDQPFLSLDPVGRGEVGVEPTESTAPPGQDGRPAEASPPVTPPPTLFAAPANMEAAMAGLPQPLESLGGPFIAKPKGEVEVEAPPAPPTVMAMATPPQPQAAQEQAATPGSKKSADPAPMADSESDPTSTIGSVEFRPGATDVQIGRKSKLTRPRLSLAAKADLVTERTRSVVLKLRLDETGKVTSAEVFRSSGSLAVDQPCQIAAYNWWFEPMKNAEGKPVKDVILFTIRFI